MTDTEKPDGPIKKQSSTLLSQARDDGTLVNWTEEMKSQFTVEEMTKLQGLPQI